MEHRSGRGELGMAPPGARARAACAIAAAAALVVCAVAGMLYGIAQPRVDAVVATPGNLLVSKATRAPVHVLASHAVYTTAGTTVSNDDGTFYATLLSSTETFANGSSITAKVEGFTRYSADVVVVNLATRFYPRLVVLNDVVSAVLAKFAATDAAAVDFVFNGAQSRRLQARELQASSSSTFSGTSSACCAGTYVSGTSCIACPLNTFSNTSGAASCTPCPAGYGTATYPTSSGPSLTGQTSCFQCAANYYSTGGGSCAVCPSGCSPAGSGCTTAQGSSCTCTAALCSALPCGAGFYNSAGTCVICPKNHFCPAGATAPVACAAGYSTCPTSGGTCSPAGQALAAACFPCKTNYVSVAGGACTACAPGLCAVAGASSCASCSVVTCSAGSYLSAGVCAPCPANSFCPANATAPTPCASGCSAAGSTSASSCSLAACPCALGYYQSSGGSCVSCPYNNYCPAGATSPTPCALGYATQTQTTPYLSYSGASACVPCAANYFSFSAGIQCYPCKNGLCSNPGSSACSLPCPPAGTCAAGSYGPPGSCTLCPAGTYGVASNATDVTACSACPEPTVSVAGSVQCTNQCPYPTTLAPYGGHSSGAACAPCASGYMVTAPDGGLATCTPCSAGSYLTSVNTIFQCAQCAPGNFSAAPAATACSVCPAGYNSSFFGATSCAMCPVGSFAVAGSASCSLCPGGTAAPTAGASSCAPCGTGLYSSPGAGSCAAGCPPGSQLVPETQACEPCSAGSASVSPSAFSLAPCTTCAAGYFSDAAAASCTPCPQGTSSAAGAAVCDLCVAGTPTGANGASCAPCEAGFYYNSSASSACCTCTPCAAGYAALSPGAKTCSLCAAGLTAVNASSCGPCPADYTSSPSYGPSCYACATGFVSYPGMSMCVCPSGQYFQSVYEYGGYYRKCYSCPSGEFSVAGVGLGNNCTSCPAGSTAPSEGSASCTACSPNFFSSSAGSTSCTACGANAVSEAAGATACVCIPGTVPSGAASCAPCAPGSFSNATSGLCVACAAGSYAPDSGSAQCSSCLAGSWSSVNASVCTPCAPSTYSPFDGATSSSVCRAMGPCAAGTFYAPGAISAIDCTPCPSGSWSDTPNALSAITCVPYQCPLGTAGPAAGSSAPVCVAYSCPPGTTYPANATGTPSCVPCPAGSWSAATDAPFGTCSLCPPGTYSTALGASSDAACTLCPRPYLQISVAAGATSCDVCVPGTVSTTYQYGEPGQYQMCSACNNGGYGYTSTYNAVSCEGACSTYPFATACCPAGEFAGLTSVPNGISLTLTFTGCFNCPVGKFLQLSPAQCNECPAGFYQPIDGTIASALDPGAACLPCAAGSSSAAGASACSACPAGSSSAVGASSCSPCPAGSICPGGGPPVPCPGGQYQHATGQTACLSCSAAAGCLGISFNSLQAGPSVFGWLGTCDSTVSPQFADGSRTNPYPAPDLYLVSPSSQYVFASSQIGGVCAATGSSSAAACCALTPDLSVIYTLESDASAPSLGTPYVTVPAADDYAPPSTSCMEDFSTTVIQYEGQLVKGCQAVYQPCACPAGMWSNSVSMNCTAYTCLAGTVYAPPGATAPTCVECGAGSYSPVRNQNSCTSCFPGRYSTTTGANSCQSGCLAGSFSAAGATACTLCSPGSSSSLAYGASSCTQCNGGFFAPMAGTPACQVCPPGSFSSPGATACSPCAAGTFSTAGASVCTPCAAGSLALSAGASRCTPCSPGSYFTLPSGAAPPNYACAPCAVGTASAAYGATACARCPPSGIAPGLGTTQCTRCPVGALNNGYQLCTACVGGSYLAGDSGQCVECGAGLYSYPPFVNVDGLQGGGTSCEPCPPGTASPNAGVTACVPCSAGSISSAVVGSTSCSQCPAGSFAKAPASSVCTLCFSGAYANASGSSACTLCPAGTSLSTFGASSVTQCLPCTYGSVAALGYSACVGCPAGSIYATSASCSKCPVGQTPAPANGTLASLSCAPCAPGSAAPANGSATCEPCAAGSYTATYGAGACSPCPAGYSSSTGATSCSLCALGSFSATPGSLCTPCPLGTNSSAVGVSSSTACAACPAGTISSGTAANGFFSATCRACSPGSFAPNASSSNCTLCAAGTFATAAGATSCTPCPIATYSSLAGADSGAACTPMSCPAGAFYVLGAMSPTDYANCAPGFYSLTVNATNGNATCLSMPPQYCGAGYFYPKGAAFPGDCSPCAAGTFSINATSACSPCPDKTWSLPGASICSMCAAGWYSQTPFDSAAPGNCTYCPPGTWGALPGATSVANCTSCPFGAFSSELAATSNATCTLCEIYGGNATNATAFGVSLGSNNATGGLPANASLSLPQACRTCPAGTYRNVVITGYVVETLNAVPVAGTRRLGAASPLLLDIGMVARSLESAFGTGEESPAGATDAVGSAAAGMAPLHEEPSQSSVRQLRALAVSTNSSSNATTNSTTNSTTIDLSIPLTINLTTYNITDPPTASLYPYFTTCSSCAVGSASNISGAHACDACAPGSSARYAGQMYCDVCVPGTFAALNGSSLCSVCAAGSFSAAGASSCTPCSAGFVSGSGASVCTPCSAGSAMNATSGECELCGPGTYQAATNASRCDACPAGTWSSVVGASSSGVCAQCPDDTYSPSPGATSFDTCTPCAAGTVSSSSTGHASCAFCTATTADINQCSVCAEGGYSTGGCTNCNALCARCPPGFTSPAGSLNASACTPCPAGSATNGGGTCVACQAGSYAANASSVQCTPCELGYVSAVVGAASASVCSMCAPGSATNAVVNLNGTVLQLGTACDVCPPGTYGPAGANGTACSSFPPLTWSNVAGATSFADAEYCPLGSYNPSSASGATSGTCIPMSCPVGKYYVDFASTPYDCGLCPGGTFSTAINATSDATCLLCAPGSASIPGSPSCAVCGAGTYAPNEGTPYCVACPGDSYGTAANATSCSPCPEYTVSATVGATSSSQCVDNSTIGCPPGFAPGPGTSCTPCGPGSYASRAGSLACTPCGIGYWSGKTGATNVSSCKPLDCLPGTYWSYPVATSRRDCAKCPPGFWSNVAAPGCFPCPGGTASNETGAFAMLLFCSLCDRGSYAYPGSAECSSFSCPMGYYAKPYGAKSPSDCQACPAGFYSDTYGALYYTTCQVCPANTYSDRPGSQACESCASGFYASPGATVCTKKPAVSNVKRWKVTVGLLSLQIVVSSTALILSDGTSEAAIAGEKAARTGATQTAEFETSTTRVTTDATSEEVTKAKPYDPQNDPYVCSINRQLLSRNRRLAYTCDTILQASESEEAEAYVLKGRKALPIELDAVEATDPLLSGEALQTELDAVEATDALPVSGQRYPLSESEQKEFKKICIKRYEFTLDRNTGLPLSEDNLKTKEKLYPGRGLTAEETRIYKKGVLGPRAFYTDGSAGTRKTKLVATRKRLARRKVVLDERGLPRPIIDPLGNVIVRDAEGLENPDTFFKFEKARDFDAYGTPVEIYTVTISIDGFDGTIIRRDLTLREVAELRIETGFALPAVGTSLGACFPLSASVAVWRKHGLPIHSTTLSLLRTGDVVRVVLPNGTLGWSPVIGNVHLDASTPSSFLALHTSSGATLRLSPLHFLPASPGDGSCAGGYSAAVWVAAEAVHVGDGVWVAGGADREGDAVPGTSSAPRIPPALRCSPVVSISAFTERGFSHPVTASLSIVVDGVAAHTFSLAPPAYVPAMFAAHPWLLPLVARVALAPLLIAHAVLAPAAALLNVPAAPALDALASAYPPAFAAIEPLAPLLVAHPASMLLLAAIPGIAVVVAVVLCARMLRRAARCSAPHASLA